jgi:hypothetical protein
LFNDSEQAQFLSSSIGLLVLLLYFPGGLMQLAYQLRDAVLAAVDRRMAQGGRGPTDPDDFQSRADARATAWSMSVPTSPG